MRRKILMLSTGGTIACKKNENGLSPAAMGKEFLPYLDSCETDFKIDVLDLFQIDSSCIQPHHWLSMARAIEDNYSEYDGFLITHGTDTMAYSASALSFLLQNVNKPIVFTGSQLPIDVEGSDAPANLKTAFRAIYANFPGVSIAFGGKIIRGCRASKLRTQSFQAFESMNVPPIVNYNAYEEPQTVCVTKNHFHTALFLCPDVFLMKITPGLKPEIFQHLVHCGYKGIVMELFGIGNFPSLVPGLLPALKDMIQSGIPVIAKSQCPYEGSSMDIYTVGKELSAAGAISAGDMTTEAAVTKLMWALGKTREIEQIRTLFSTNFSGEITL